MWDLNEEWASVEVVEALIKVFFAKGGQFFQGNVTGVQELIDAKNNPEKYPNLIVRVGGFSARFTMLNPELQDEIINRKRHNR